MKRCAICHHDNADEAATCPKCGEASWLASSAQPAPVPEPPRRSRAPKGER